MQVGNTWKYKGSSYQGNINNSYSDSILRVVGVFTHRQSSDTNFYGILIWDSLFNRRNGAGPISTPIPDLVRTIPDSQIEVLGVITRAVFTSNYAHLMVDSRISGKILFGGQDHWVFNDYDPRNPSYVPRGYFAQDIGRISYQQSASIPGSLSSSSYSLIEFNGIPLGNYTVIGVLGKFFKSRKPAVFPMTEFGTILGTNRNVLGRVPFKK